MIDNIVQQLKQEDYDEATGSDTEEDDEDFGTTALATIDREQPTAEEEPPTIEDFDLDTLLDKISKHGIDSLSPTELQFLKSFGN